MPPKGKAAQKPKASDTLPKPSPTQPPPAAPPQTTPTSLADRSKLRLDQSRPLEVARRQNGFATLSRDDQAAWFAARFAHKPPPSRARLPAKVQRDLWRHVNEGSVPLRTLRDHTTSWGRDRFGQEIGGYSIKRYHEWTERRVLLTVLEAASRAFAERRDRAARGEKEAGTDDEVVVADTEVESECLRRHEMAALRKELYGANTGRFALDPDWDDVIPIPQDEPEGALAAIAYPAEYAEAISYLRAVMVAKEYSPRCLRLTETIIGMNPAHYTVWLYRAANIQALNLPIPDEITWLNDVALQHLKNYQIWHHRHLLIDNFFPTIEKDPDAVASLAASERDFLAQILAHDTKNYHVWSYRSYLVAKLGLWDDADELSAVEALIDDDVRNNSAWSHRFFLVFSHPERCTPGTAATEADPAAPPDIVDREIAYAKEKIVLAPQNQSPWNYLRGVLVKGSRKLASVETFVQDFVTGLGEKGGEEDVQSTHALDLLAEIYAEKGDKEKADLCLRRLGEKWDRIRIGYWEWRRKQLGM